mmetsp:Transcript_21764/g.66058  ORF Transcript_21764/g.66058 Transcript_21764/m.66058 type:complete len:403 (+) Transcript_21764:537-1745(+)|eukprot:scaffold226774_cov24-Tisochrysis_lutea.AAC.1
MLAVARTAMRTRANRRTHPALFAQASLDGLHNPAFLRHHPSKPLIYVATETITEPGDIITLAYDPTAGPSLRQTGVQSAHGASTCYLTLTSPTDKQWMLAVNYWDSVISVLPTKPCGTLEPVACVLPPPMPVRARGIEDHLRDRQSEPHAHAVVLDPSFGRIAFVPDLGTDMVRLYLLDPASGSLSHAGTIPCAPTGTGPHGPRYIEFDPSRTAAYVVNELSSTVSVFRFCQASAGALIHADASGRSKAAEVLQLVQVVSTLEPVQPGLAPRKNTCGRIAVAPNGKFVLVSNRGDDSIACFAIEREAGTTLPPRLRTPTLTKTGGATPRHFQFAGNGSFVIAANQDSDSLAVFKFCPETGQLHSTGKLYEVASPNFVATFSSREGVGPLPGIPIPTSISGEF